MKTIKKVLIANRGEIAIRIHHTLKQMGIQSVGIYSEEDKNSYHRLILDENYYIGNGSLLNTYLNIEKIISIAKKSKCEAIHPGHGFLSENYKFAEACEKENLIFIGPPFSIIRTMGDKIESKNIAKRIGIPVLESITGTKEEILNAIRSKNIDFPILIKASAGGGGKGMRILYSDKNLDEELTSAQREAKNYFGNDSIFVEKFIENPRHIEVQILADSSGNFIHLFERECSIQRRYQKIIEEAPSPTLTEKERNQLYNYALLLCREIGYKNAGTIEFLYDEKEKQFYFLEMNTRIQVEHPVTEMITGIDIVKEQILISQDKKISYSQKEIIQNGHSIEVRIYAEDPENHFLPCPGMIYNYIEPNIPYIRIDSAIKYPQKISSNFDPMISKVISWGKYRQEAIERLIYGLKNYIIHGIKTNINYLIEILNSEEFRKNNINTNFCKSFVYNEKNLSTEALLAIALYKENNKIPPKNNYTKDTQNNIWKHIGKWSNV